MAEDILEKIVAVKRQEVNALHRRRTLAQWEQEAATSPPAPDFFAPFAEGKTIRAIAEIKKASPSAGVIRPDFDPPVIARQYQAAGAACISVLTDTPFFQGSLADLSDVRQAVNLPLLRKDFVIDPAQVFEARIAGASAVLLIAECLEAGPLRDLIQLIESLAMTPLVELYDPANVDRVVDAGAKLIGINNRNLRTFKTDLAHTLELLPRIPSDRRVISESGIRDRQDVVRLEQAGVAGILVGESLMRAENPGSKLAELLALPSLG